MSIDYTEKDPIHLFFFHPLHKTHSDEKKAASIITTIALSIITGGIYLIIFATINYLDNRKVTKRPLEDKVEIVAKKTEDLVKDSLIRVSDNSFSVDDNADSNEVDALLDPVIDPTVTESDTAKLPSAQEKQSAQKENDTTKIDQDYAKDFWETYFKDSNFHRLTEMILNRSVLDEFLALFSSDESNPENINNLGLILFENFVEYKRHNTTNGINSYSIPDEKKEKLIAEIEFQFRNLATQNKKNNGELKAFNTDTKKYEKIQTFSTKGDGTCGLHALIGVLKNGRYECPNGAEKDRADFCNRLKERYQDKTNPENTVLINLMNTILFDYITSQQNCPSGFKDNSNIKTILKDFKKEYDKFQERINQKLVVKQVFENRKQRLEQEAEDSLMNNIDIDTSLTEQIDNLTKQIAQTEEERKEIIKERDTMVNKVMENSAIFEAYLENLKRVGQYLLQDELQLAAICFNKRVKLYQPGWGNDRFAQYGVINKKGNEEVCIWYNGFNHYERAEVTSSNNSNDEDN